MTAGRLFPTSDQGAESDERYTPRAVFDAMAAVFDLDPAAPPGGVPWIPARAHYSRTDDGLAQPWHGLVWLNPPFSDPAPWARRWLDHGAGVMLFPLSVNASWMFDLLRAVPLVVMLEHLRFVSPTHVGRHVPVAVALAGTGPGVDLAAAAGRRLRSVTLRVG